MAVQVVIKRRTTLLARSAPARAPERMDLSEVLERLQRLSDMAHRITGVSRLHPEQFAIDKSDLVRAIGRLEADLRRRGVR